MYEETSKVTEKTLDIKRAIDSLREEIEAIDLYNQRADATQDEDLKKVLLHNAKEEKEHSAMLIEWLRKNDAELEDELKEYLFKS
ncbi:ferritin [Patescibacteria group bacterium]|nr:ferritin [Patescibacteria group bacterium]